jgi:hypothetical protein
VTAAIFGLLGVIVGGLLQGGWTWTMERRRESWAARKAARLFAPALHRCLLAVTHAKSRGWTWGDLVTTVEANVQPWPDHAAVFAGTLEWDEWFEIYAAARALEQLTWNAPDDPDQRIGPGDHEYLEKVASAVTTGAVVCGAVGVSGTGVRGWRRYARRMRMWLRPPSERTMLVEVFGDEGADQILADDEET